MKITAVMPVFNEEKTLLSVLNVINNTEVINEIIVVDDASSDNSRKKINSIKSNKITIISLKKNLGKSDAVKVAVQSTKTDILLFCDADLINLSEEHINQIVRPLIDGKLLMSVGLRDYGLIGNYIYKNYLPLIAGERAIPYSIFKETMNNPFMKDYALEVVLNDYCKKNSIPIYKNTMKGLKQTVKHKKWKNGAYLLAKEMFQILMVIVMLKIKRY